MSERQLPKRSTTGTSTDELRCRSLTEGEIDTAHRIIRDVFEEQVAPLYTEDGRRAFLDYISVDGLTSRFGRGHELIGAEAVASGALLGVAEVRRCTHVALLFVRTAYQRAGVGRALVSCVAARCRRRGRRIITVNAAPNAVAAYRALGFAEIGPERDKSGIRSVPMQLSAGELQ